MRQQQDGREPNGLEHSVPVSLDPGALGLCDRAVRTPSRLLPDAVPARITAILTSWDTERAGESS
jgi:hypothetical protein